ncbi:hypothetical protein ACS0TY_030550 [Phlomoides rotata]
MVPAAVTCKADAAALCITYDRGIHSANPLARRHERSAVVPFYDTAESMDLTTVDSMFVRELPPQDDKDVGLTQKGLIDISMGVKTHLSEQLMKQFSPIMHQRRIGKQPKQWEFSIEFSIGCGGPGFQVHSAGNQVYSVRFGKKDEGMNRFWFSNSQLSNELVDEARFWGTFGFYTLLTLVNNMLRGRFDTSPNILSILWRISCCISHCENGNDRLSSAPSRNDAPKRVVLQHSDYRTHK